MERQPDKQAGKKDIQPIQDTGTTKWKDLYDQVPNVQKKI